MKKDKQPSIPLTELYKGASFKEAPVNTKISLIRQAKGMTQEELGRQMVPAVDRHRVNKIENKSIQLRMDTLKQICTGLGVEVSVLF